MVNCMLQFPRSFGAESIFSMRTIAWQAMASALPMVCLLAYFVYQAVWLWPGAGLARIGWWPLAAVVPFLFLMAPTLRLLRKNNEYRRLEASLVLGAVLRPDLRR